MRRGDHRAQVDAWILHEIQSRCTLTEDGCWLWKQACSAAGHPVIGGRVAGRRTRYAHRLAWVAAGRPALHSGHVLTSRCGHEACCNPEHRRRWMRTVWERSAEKRRSLSRGPAHAAAVTVKRRQGANVRYSFEVARAMRARFAVLQNYTYVAREFEAPVGDVHRIVTGKYWREPSPFRV